MALKIDKIQGAAAIAQFSELLDQAFELPPGHHYLDDFPVWDERLAPSGDDLLKVGVFNDETLLASAAARFAELKGSAGRPAASIAIIGAVATHADWRGQGLASRAVSLTLEWATAKRAAMAVLWGSEHSLYGRLGFFLRGQQARVPLSAFVAPQGACAVHSGWHDGLFPLLRSRPQGLSLRESDLNWVRAHRNTQWYWTGTKERPTAYVAFGKGIDLGGMVHEWGGERGDLFHILATVEAQHPGAQLLGAPSVFAEYGFLPAEASEPLCLAKVLQPGVAPQEFWLWGLDSA